MICVEFRVFEDDGTPGEWTGFAVAPCMKSLFWQIDEHLNPLSVKIREVDIASVCYKDEPDEEPQFTEVNIESQDDWFDPPWLDENIRRNYSK